MKSKETTDPRLDEFEQQISRIVALLDEPIEDQTDSHADEREVSYFTRSLVERESLIALVGERGSGKTTLLNAVCSKILRSNEHILLPILRPELMGENEDSLIPLVLGRATEMFEERLAHAINHIDEKELVLQQAVRAGALFSDSAFSTIAAGRSSLSQFAVDTASLFRSRIDIGQSLSALFSLLRTMGGANAKVIIPIDDADLVPGRITRLLADVRILSSCAGVVPIICVSRQDLAENLEADLASSMISAESSVVRRRVEKQIAKTLRPDRTFEPLQLGRGERLSYKPAGETEPLLSILITVFDMLEGVSNSAFAQWLVGNSQLDPIDRSASLRLDWVPDTYRTIHHLYLTARDLRDTFASGHSNSETAFKLRRFLLEILRESPSIEINMHFSSAKNRSLAGSAAWPNVSIFLGASGIWTNVFQNATTRFATRRVLKPSAVVDGAADEIKTQDTKRVRLRPNETSAILLVQSILNTGIFSDSKPGGPLVLGETDISFLQSCKVHGLATDDHFLLLPRAQGFYVDRLFDLWNWATDAGANQTSKSGPIGTVLNRVLVGIEFIWLQGKPVPKKALARSLTTSIETVAALYILHVPTYSGDLDQYSPESAFCHWFETLLPNVFHEALLNPGSLTSLLDVWHATISTQIRSQSGTAASKAIFEKRMVAGRKEGRSKAWLFGYRSVIRLVSQELSLILGEYEKEYLERSGRGSKGREVMESSVALSELANKYQFATRRTVEADAQETTIRRVLDQLRAQ
jgi:energy-coupling factor transporter ATP-binding protein EcfA2